MKTIIRLTTLLLLTVMALPGKAQIITCSGTSTVITAVNSAGLSNPSYSMNPGGISSSNGIFTVAPGANTTYTVYVTGTNSNSAIVTTTNIAAVQVIDVTFSLTSPQNFTLGCNTASACGIQITNAQSSIGSPLVFAILPPGSSTLLPVTFNNITTLNVTVPGLWLVAAHDAANACTTWSTVNVSLNTTPPPLGTVSVPQNPLTCTTPSMVVQTAPNPALSFSWQPFGVSGHSVVVNSNTLSPNINPLVTLNLIVTDNNNLCQSSTVIPVYQNLFKPNAVIGGPSPAPCSNTIILVNMSSTGIPAGTGFSTIQPVVGMLWEGPSPQPSVSFSTTYSAQVSGIYTMTALDMNNGCTNTGTYAAVVGPGAAFVHTITGGQATFNDVSTGPTSGVSWFWDFGDGNTSTLQNPVHYYQYSGAYLVKFKVISLGAFCTDSVIQSVNISGAPCSANSNFSMVPTGTPQVWNVVPSYPWNVTAASWSWGDGFSSSTLYTSHQYATAGIYTICLTVTISCGDTSTTCTSYNVYRGSEANLMLQVNVVAPELISGLGSQAGNEQVSWTIVPNPNAGTFALEIQTVPTENIRIVISDLTGRIVYDQASGSAASSVSIQNADLPSGMYLVTLQSGQQKLTKRMIIQH